MAIDEPFQNKQINPYTLSISRESFSLRVYVWLLRFADNFNYSGLPCGGYVEILKAIHRL